RAGFMRFASCLGALLVLLFGAHGANAQGWYCPPTIGLGKITISLGVPRYYVGPTYGYAGVLPIGYPSPNQMTYIQFYSPAPPPVVAPPRARLNPGDDDLALPQTPLPGAPASVFRPVGRENRAQAQRKA